MRFVDGEQDDALTGDQPVEQRQTALAEQAFAPYTDLLLHDLGPDLADQRPEYQADGREWRTPPLWGLGLV
ncbi:MAG TPA: di-heme oxidoredictase family protein, partial [Accumulibacter sp.]|nr:di-heme oxidoredictase family protein [Accumulibacter sp.]